MSKVLSSTQVLHYSSDPQQVIEHAQVVLITESAWYIHGPYLANGSISFAPIPPVNCPVVDLSQLPQYLDIEINKILKAHEQGNKYGQLDVMLAELQKLGAVISYPIRTEGKSLASYLEEMLHVQR